MTLLLNRGRAKFGQQGRLDYPSGPYGRRCQSRRNVYPGRPPTVAVCRHVGSGGSVCHRRRERDIRCGEKTPWLAPSKTAGAKSCDAADQISRSICPEHSVSSPNAPSPVLVRCSDAGWFVGVAWRLPPHCYIDGNDCGRDREVL